MPVDGASRRGRRCDASAPGREGARGRIPVGMDSAPKTPPCSVVIRCHDEEAHIGRLLSGILRQTVRDVEIVVVDSGSTDATLSIVSQYPVKVLSIPPADFSFGRALNLGCAAASAPLLVFASAHVYPVYEDWLERLLAPFADPRVALAYGRQRGDERTHYSEHRVFARWFPDTSEHDQKHPFCNNANAAIRRSVWEQLPYDEELTGLEDIDWARRASEAGHRIAYAPDAEIVHVHEESPRRIYNRYRREAIAMKRIFPHERFGLVDLVRLWATNLASDAFSAVREGKLWRSIRSIVMFRTMQLWGTYRGFNRHGPVSSTLKRTFYYPNGWLDRPAAGHRDARRIDYGTLEHDGR